MSREKLGTIVAIISGLSFATLAILSKLAATGGASVANVLFWRFTGATMVFLVYLTVHQKLQKYDWATVGKLLVMGALGYGSMSACFLLAVERIPASLASMFLYLYPAFVTLVTVALKQETLNWRKIAALLAASAGLILVLGASFNNIDPRGIALALGAAVIYTIYIVAGSKVISTLEPINSTMYIMLGGAIVYGLVGLFTHSLTASFSPATWLVLGGIILIPTVLAVLLFWLGVQFLGPTRTSIISTIEPLFTAILAWWAFGERLSATQLAGGLLVIGSIAILQYPSATKKEKSPEIVG